MAGGYCPLGLVLIIKTTKIHAYRLSVTEITVHIACCLYLNPNLASSSAKLNLIKLLLWPACHWDAFNLAADKNNMRTEHARYHNKTCPHPQRYASEDNCRGIAIFSAQSIRDKLCAVCTARPLNSASACERPTHNFCIYFAHSQVHLSLLSSPVTVIKPTLREFFFR